MRTLTEHTAAINTRLARYGIRYGKIENHMYYEQRAPFDGQPCVLPADVFARLAQGVAQRVHALNLFLQDVYGAQHILRAGVIPSDFVHTSAGFLPQCAGLTKDGFLAAAAVDVVRGADGVWYALSDRTAAPAGMVYPLVTRELARMDCDLTGVADISRLGQWLAQSVARQNAGGAAVVLTPGRSDPRWFEHHVLAERMGVPLVSADDLFVEDDVLFRRLEGGQSERIGAVLRRVPDALLDPRVLSPDSTCGVPGLLGACRAGNVRVLNTPGSGLAEDGGLYHFVPRIIEYYLHETPILPNIPTFLPYYESERKYIIDHLSDLIVEDVEGGYGTVDGAGLNAEQLTSLRRTLISQSRRFVARRKVTLASLTTEDGAAEQLGTRLFAVAGEQGPCVWPGGLTRFARDGHEGFQDTWVMQNA